MRAMLAVVASIALAVMSWGSYIPVLHKGQADMGGSRLRPFICVGLAYFVIAVLVPLVVLMVRGEKGSWTRKGLIFSFCGGTFGALGALGVILAQNAGGAPLFVIPLIFGCAPVVNTFVTIAINKSYKEVSPLLLAGLILVVAGAVAVLIFKPSTGNAAGGGFLEAVNSSIQVLVWVAFTALCWGIYGPILHKGQAAMSGSRLRPFLCVGLAYMVIAVVIPFALLGAGAETAANGTVLLQPKGEAMAEAAKGASLHFTVADRGGKPVSGASVFLNDSLIGSTSDTGIVEVRFEKGPALLRIVKDDYLELSQRVDFSSDAEVKVALAKSSPSWTTWGISYSLAGGAAGALGALGIILAFNFGGKPVYVMPLVFGGAPVVGTIISLAVAGSGVPVSPYFYAGLISVAVGAVTVLVFAPKPHAHAPPAKREASAKPEKVASR